MSKFIAFLNAVVYGGIAVAMITTDWRANYGLLTVACLYAAGMALMSLENRQ